MNERIIINLVSELVGKLAIVEAGGVSQQTQ